MFNGFGPLGSPASFLQSCFSGPGLYRCLELFSSGSCTCLCWTSWAFPCPISPASQDAFILQCRHLLYQLPLTLSHFLQTFSGCSLPCCLGQEWLYWPQWWPLGILPVTCLQSHFKPLSQCAEASSSASFQSISLSTCLMNCFISFSTLGHFLDIRIFRKIRSYSILFLGGWSN